MVQSEEVISKIEFTTRSGNNVGKSCSIWMGIWSRTVVGNSDSGGNLHLIGCVSDNYHRRVRKEEQMNAREVEEQVLVAVAMLLSIGFFILVGKLIEWLIRR